MAEGHHEIVIIRRGGHGDHDEHHGGVWKIAFADFMTAMMAFFLVLWLISANDKTRASVARYFNPVRLVDATTQPRGLHESKKDDSGVTASPNTKDNKEADQGKAPSETQAATAPDTETPKGREKRLDTELRDNPYLALAEIVGDKGPGEDALKSKPAPNPAIGHGGSAFRDPFAPPPPSIKSSAKSADDQTLTETEPAPAQKPLGATLEAKDLATPPSDAKPAATAFKSNTDIKDEAHKQIEIEKQTEALKTKLALALKGLGPDQDGPAIDVKKTSEGTLLSLTDTSEFTMFSNGSAVPSKHVVLMMEKIAQILKEKPGQIVIRGFTDNKKFRSSRYDNWHLSLDRAQVAHYMLARGGLADDRMSHVEGYADRGTLSGVDPASPRNRRIEILLKDNPQ